MLSMKKNSYIIILILVLFIVYNYNNIASSVDITMSDNTDIVEHSIATEEIENTLIAYESIATKSIATRSVATQSIPTESVSKRKNVKQEKKEFIPVKYVGEKVIEGKDGWLFFDENIKEYTGESTITEKEIKKHTEKFIKLKKLVEDTFNKKLIFIVFPEKEEVYSEYVPSFNIVEEEERVLKIKKYLEENTDVCFLYPKEELINAKDYFRVYYKYDNHYNKIGAFIGNEVLKKEIGIEETKLSDMVITRKKIDTGNLILLSYNKDEKKDDDFDYDIEYKKNINVAQMRDKEEYQKYLSTAEHKKRIVFIGDSFRFNLIEFMQRDYNDTTFMFIGQKTYSDEQLNDILNADVIILEAVERFEKTTYEPTVDVLLDLFTKLKMNTK